MFQPEIMYESDDGGLTSRFPFIQVAVDQDMPKFLFILESRDTGETEPGPDGEDLAIVNMEMHQYANMSVLKQQMTQDQFDLVRAALGLEPLAVASRKGEKITETVRKNLE